jgi:hypothetical protein
MFKKGNFKTGKRVPSDVVKDIMDTLYNRDSDRFCSKCAFNKLTPMSLNNAKNVVDEFYPQYKQTLYMGLVLETRKEFKARKKAFKQQGIKYGWKQFKKEFCTLDLGNEND